MVNDHSLTLRTHLSLASESTVLSRFSKIGTRLVQGGMITLLSWAGLASSHLPNLLDQHHPWTISSTASAQPALPTFTDIEIQNYALAVLRMEPFRQAAYNDIKKVIGNRELPAIACHRKREIDNLPVDIRGIAINYCNQSRKIVISNGLTIARFNEITNSINTDQTLEQRIQAELIRLQNLPPSPPPR